MIEVYQENGEYVFSRGSVVIGKTEKASLSIRDRNASIITCDMIENCGSEEFIWTRVFMNNSNESKKIIAELKFIANYESKYSMIPAVSYNGNRWGQGNEPKGFSCNGKSWVFAYHRVAIPGATFSMGDEFSVAMFGQFSESIDGFSCSLIPVEKGTEHILKYPEEESPLSYSDRDTFTPGYSSTLVIQPDEKLVLKAIIMIRPAAGAAVPYAGLLDFAWRKNYSTVLFKASPDKVWRLGLAYADDCLWTEEEGFTGFSLGLLHSEEGWYKPQHWKYEIGWCGQNASLAVSFLVDYQRRGQRKYLERGLACLDSWAGNARLANGLMRCHFDYLLNPKIDKPEVQDACNLGAAADNFFEAYQVAAQCGWEKPGYLLCAYGICDFSSGVQQDCGKFGKAWSNDGVCVDAEGGTGCYLVPPLLKAYALSKQTRYLDAAQKGFAYYQSLLETNGYATAGALDTYCIDKESAIPLLKSALLLYHVTDDVQYLQAAERAAYYLSTWQWHYSVPFPQGSPLREIGYDTFGGTAVSVQHHHLDCYALSYVNELLELAELLHNPVWQQRALAIWANALQGISDGGLAIGGVLRPAGGQDEGFYHTCWKNSCGVSNWLVAWPTAFRLEVLRKAATWSVFDYEISRGERS